MKPTFALSLVATGIAVLGIAQSGLSQFESLEQLTQERTKLLWEIQNLESSTVSKNQLLQAEISRLAQVQSQISTLQPKLEKAKKEVPVLRAQKEAAEAHVRAAQQALVNIESADTADKTAADDLDRQVGFDDAEIKKLKKEMVDSKAKWVAAKKKSADLDAKRIQHLGRYNELNAEKQSLFETIDSLWKEHGADTTSEERKVQIVAQIQQIENVRMPQIGTEMEQADALKNKYEQEALECEEKEVWKANYDFEVAEANHNRITDEMNQRKTQAAAHRKSIKDRQVSRDFENNKVTTQQAIADQKSAQIQQLGNPDVMQQEMNSLLSQQAKLNGSGTQIGSIQLIKNELSAIQLSITNKRSRLDMIGQRIVVISPTVFRSRSTYQDGGMGGISFNATFQSANQSLPSPQVRKLPGGREIHFYGTAFSVLWNSNNTYAEPEMMVAREGYTGPIRGRDLTGSSVDVVFQQDLKFLMVQDLNNDKKFDEADLLLALDRGFASGGSFCSGMSSFSNCTTEVLSYNSVTGDADMIFYLENTALRIGRKRISSSTAEMRYFIQRTALTKERISNSLMLKNMVKQALTMP